MVLQNYQNLKEMTSNIFHIVAVCVGFKGPREIHLNTECPPPPTSDYVIYEWSPGRPDKYLPQLQWFMYQKRSEPSSGSIFH